jgi:hypothetical protein
MEAVMRELLGGLSLEWMFRIYIAAVLVVTKLLMVIELSWLAVPFFLLAMAWAPNLWMRMMKLVESRSS